MPHDPEPISSGSQDTTITPVPAQSDGTVVRPDRLPLPRMVPAGEILPTTLEGEAAPPLTAAAPPEIAGYEILGVLGRGGMGIVYKAQQRQPRRVVALKMILAGGHAGPGDLRRFEAEAEAVARLQHPHIVHLCEVGRHGDVPYFTLEFCPGGSLEKKLAKQPQPPNEAAALAETLARAVHHAHRAGIVHRDLKPANVLLAEDGPPKVTDFGLAKQAEAGLTASHAVMGTPSYMAPEQAEGRTKAVGPAADVWALGAILYECLTGRPPFQAPTTLDTIRQVVSEEPVPPTRLVRTVPRDLETSCLKCLQKEPARRYASAEALAEDLRRFRMGKPILARPVGSGERAVKWVRRNPVVAGLLAAVGAALLTGTAVSTYFAFDAERKAGELERANTRLGELARRL